VAKTNSPSYGDLLSPIGFAYAPQVLNFLTLIPLLGQPIERVLAVWSLLAVILQYAIDISTSWAALLCLVGWPLIQVAIGLVQTFEQEALLKLISWEDKITRFISSWNSRIPAPTWPLVFCFHPLIQFLHHREKNYLLPKSREVSCF